jgi:hypothetical protein
MQPRPGRGRAVAWRAVPSEIYTCGSVRRDGRWFLSENVRRAEITPSFSCLTESSLPMLLTSSTNMIENPHSGVRWRTRRILRWPAAARLFVVAPGTVNY